jgi:hypothetical protein
VISAVKDIERGDTRMFLLMHQNGKGLTKWKNTLVSCPATTTTDVIMILIAATLLVIPLAAVDALNYNGTCDDVIPPWTELKLEKGDFEKVVYSSLYENDDCSGPYWGTGVSMNFEGLNCAPSPDNNGNICFRCINGTLSVSHFDIRDIPDINATTHAAYLEQAVSTAYMNCADGCGYTCYKLREQLSMRVGWNSADQPVCSNAPEVCPDVAPPQPTPTTTSTEGGTSSSSVFHSPFVNFLNVLLAGLVGVGLSADLIF